MKRNAVPEAHAVDIIQNILDPLAGVKSNSFVFVILVSSFQTKCKVATNNRTTTPIPAAAV